MPFHLSATTRTRAIGLIAAAGVLALVFWALTRGSSLVAEPPQQAGAHVASHEHAHAPMTAEDMRRWVEEWYAAHPERGLASLDDPVDTFMVYSFGFDTDGNRSNRDTMHIFSGQTVLWKLSDGFHTTTNGTGSLDPGVGSLFDQPIDPSHQEFPFQFANPGLVPFFCRPHEGLMFGFVDVRPPTDVVPISGRDLRAGFVANPAPNPMHDLASFRFAVSKAGRARVEVFDVRGRRVAMPVDRNLDPGTYAAAWDGRTSHGERATAGVYYLRLTIPGSTDSRELVVTR
jgi:plastocyanin